jgi:hypothetical protein
VAFHATRICPPTEVCRPVLIARAIDPAMPIAPITYRQLIQPVAMPVQISLSSNARANHNVDLLRSSQFARATLRNGSLEKPICPCFHQEIESRISISHSGPGDREPVRSPAKRSQNRVCIGVLRSKVMGGVKVGARLLPMATSAGGIARVAPSAACRCLRKHSDATQADQTD